MSNHVTSGTSRKWHHNITIDLFARVLSNSIFHPFVAWLVPLCLRSLQAPYESIEFITACAYAGLVTFFWMLSVINKRVAYGIPRTVDWDHEVVVITGGANGLGKIIAQTYGMRGASVAILDIAEPDKDIEDLGDVHFYKCDIGDADAVAKIGEAIKQEVSVSLADPSLGANNLQARSAHHSDQQCRHRQQEEDMGAHYSRCATHDGCQPDLALQHNPHFPARHARI